MSWQLWNEKIKIMCTFCSYILDCKLISDFKSRSASFEWQASTAIQSNISKWLSAAKKLFRLVEKRIHFPGCLFHERKINSNIRCELYFSDIHRSIKEREKLTSFGHNGSPFRESLITNVTYFFYSARFIKMKSIFQLFASMLLKVWNKFEIKE